MWFFFLHSLSSLVFQSFDAVDLLFFSNDCDITFNYFISLKSYIILKLSICIQRWSIELVKEIVCLVIYSFCFTSKFLTFEKQVAGQVTSAWLYIALTTLFPVCFILMTFELLCKATSCIFQIKCNPSLSGTQLNLCDKSHMEVQLKRKHFFAHSFRC